jgi:hypothetical protein
VSIRERGEMLSLTDMWRAAGGDPSKRPAKWRDHDATREFVEHVQGTILRGDSECFQSLNGGGEWNTWAHWQIGLTDLTTQTERQRGANSTPSPVPIGCPNGANGTNGTGRDTPTRPLGRRMMGAGARPLVGRGSG